MELGLDEMVKSPTPTVIIVVWESGPLIDVIVTVYVPWVDELKVQVEVAEPPDVRETLLGVQDAERPVDGFAVSERATLPAKPPRLINVTVDVPFEPDWKPTVDGLAETL